jgi:hypothetical protein
MLLPPGPRPLLHLAADAAALQDGAYLSTPMVLAAVQKVGRARGGWSVPGLLSALERVLEVVPEAQLSIGTHLLPSQVPGADAVAERACLLIAQQLNDLVFRVFSSRRRVRRGVRLRSFFRPSRRGLVLLGVLALTHVLWSFAATGPTWTGTGTSLWRCSRKLICRV